MPNNNVRLLGPHIVAKVWGGKRLAKLKKLATENGPIGESWEVSANKEGESITEDGMKLSHSIDVGKLPYLVKFIDTEDDLSIQVHPGDVYAKAHEDSKGKEECWAILAASKGAGIYLGLQAGVTKEILKTAIIEKEDISKLLKFFPVKTGQFFYIPAGTVHAIGKGVFLAEVQQNSGITYRVWDWNRVGLDGKQRTLHIKKALDVINFDKQFNEFEYFLQREDVILSSTSSSKNIISRPDFNIRVLKFNDGENGPIKSQTERYISILCLQGVALIGDKKLCSFHSLIITEGVAEVISQGETILLCID